jgi:hypothetical protein
MSQLTVNAIGVKKAMAWAVEANLVLMIHGSPGIGKSSVVYEIAKDYGLLLIDVRLAQCDPTDINGFPFILECKTKAGYVPMETFPLEGDPIPAGYQGWLIFFDEINSAARMTQAASYKVILDKMVGQQKIHPNVVMAAAGNLDTDNAIVEDLSSALQSRMLHLTMRSDADCWLPIAARYGIDPRITSFVRFMPKYLNNFNPSKQGDDHTFACERTWFFVDKLLKVGLDINCYEAGLPLLAGTVGEGVARAFVGHVKVYQSLPEIAEICANPMGTPVPVEPGHLWAMGGSIAHHISDQNVKPLMDYLERFPKEYQVVTVREMAQRNVEVFSIPRVADWLLKNGVDMF